MSDVDITVDGQRYSVKTPLTGADIRRLTLPPLADDYDLVQTAGPGGDDVFVGDDQVIDPQHGSRFFSVPRMIMAGTVVSAG